MSQSPLRVGVIGCGFFAENHLAAWTANEGVKLTAVCDLDIEKARLAAMRHGASHVFSSAAELMDSGEVDFVDIATTMRSHVELVGQAAMRGLPVIVQKPLAPTYAECLSIIETCKAAKVPFMVHENTRFLTPVRRVRAILDSDAIGTVTWGRVAFRTGHDIYGKQPYLAHEDHFVLLDLGVHMLDVARYLFGDVTRLYCQSQSIKPGIRGEDMATTLLSHQCGATSVVECSYASPIHPDPFPELTLSIEGTRGSLRLDPGYRLSVFADGQAEVHDVSPRLYAWSTPPWHGTQESVLRIQQHWIDCLRNGREPETSGTDSRKTYGLVFGAYESARSGQSVIPLD
jgi:predicted dehydrogenase